MKTILPKTSCDIPMPRSEKVLGNVKRCSSCTHKEVCSLIEKTQESINRICEISAEYENIILDIRCSHFMEISCLPRGGSTIKSCQ